MTLLIERDTTIPVLQAATRTGKGHCQAQDLLVLSIMEKAGLVCLIKRNKTIPECVLHVLNMYLAVWKQIFPSRRGSFVAAGTED